MACFQLSRTAAGSATPLSSTTMASRTLPSMRSDTEARSSSEREQLKKIVVQKIQLDERGRETRNPHLPRWAPNGSRASISLPELFSSPCATVLQFNGPRATPPHGVRVIAPVAVHGVRYELGVDVDRRHVVHDGADLDAFGVFQQPLQRGGLPCDGTYG